MKTNRVPRINKGSSVNLTLRKGHPLSVDLRTCVHLRSRVEWALDEYRGQVQDYVGKIRFKRG